MARIGHEDEPFIVVPDEPGEDLPGSVPAPTPEREPVPAAS